MSRITMDEMATLENGTVTIRDRDTMQQISVHINELRSYFEEHLK